MGDKQEHSTDESSSQKHDIHNGNLLMLCRICGALLTGYKYSVAENAVVRYSVVG